MTLSMFKRPLRREALRDALLDTVDLLHHRRASEIKEDDIDDYVALKWLEWNGGGLRLTASGDTLCRQLRAQLR